MKVVYLDIDGVLNGRASRGPDVQSDDPIELARWAMARSRVRRVNDLCERTGASIVISSSWRLSWRYADLRAALQRGGITAPIVGMTHPGIDDRWRAIIRDRADRAPDRWMVLDDEPCPYVWSNVVQTSWDAGGITDADVERAVAILEGSSPGPTL